MPLLVRGAGAAHLGPLGDAEELSDPTFEASSTGAVCLLGDPPATASLAGHCDFSGMLTRRLDNERAPILASAVSPGAGHRRRRAPDCRG